MKKFNFKKFNWIEKLLYLPIAVAWTFFAVSAFTRGQHRAPLAVQILAVVGAGFIWAAPLIMNQSSKYVQTLMKTFFWMSAVLVFVWTLRSAPSNMAQARTALHWSP